MTESTSSEATTPDTNDAAPEPVEAESGTDWQAEARKWEARAKENKTAKVELDRLKHANMTETERISADLAETARERDDAVSKLARVEAALRHGLDMNDLDLLGSGSADEIEDRAKRLAARLAESGAPRKPQPDPSQGRRTPPGTSTADQFAAALTGIL